jgi:hypothetical protein
MSVHNVHYVHCVRSRCIAVPLTKMLGKTRIFHQFEQLNLDPIDREPTGLSDEKSEYPLIKNFD